MANVREFDPLTNDELSCAVGALSAMTYGTYVLLVERLEVDVAHTITAPHTSGGTGSGIRAAWSQFNDTSLVAGDGAPSNVSGQGAANVAKVLVWRKATATATPRLSAYDTTQGWAHADGHAAIADGTAPGVDGTIRFAIGQFTGRGHFRIGAAAAWPNEVKWATDVTGDLAIENAGLHTAYQNWIDATPGAAWRFNQSSTSTAVVDDTGNGADQTAITGTTVVDDPAFDFFDFSLGGGPVTGAAVLSASGTLTAAGQGTSSGAAALTAVSALTAAGSATSRGAVSMSASGSLTAAGTATSSGAAALTAEGTLTASTGSTKGAASLSATGTMTTSAQARALATVALSAAATLTAAATPRSPGAAALAASGTLTVTAAGTAFAAVVLSALGTLTASGRAVPPVPPHPEVLTLAAVADAHTLTAIPDIHTITISEGE